MGFKRQSLRSKILWSIAVLMLLLCILGKWPSSQAQSGEAFNASLPSLPVEVTTGATRLKTLEVPDEEEPSMKEIKEQIDNDRQQQKKIKMLKIQLEQANLQLQEEKALSQINQLKKENAGIVDNLDGPLMDQYPDLKVIYIGGSGEDREAVVSINGVNYSVRPKTMPVKNMEVLSISNASVTVHFSLPQEMTTTIDYKAQ